MSEIFGLHSRRKFLSTSAAATAAAIAGSFGLFPAQSAAAATATGSGLDASARGSIRPFRVHVPQKELVDLHRRITATRWPDMETVADQSQGVPLATMKKLARYWASDYDWRKVEARLNALPQFITEIDGLDIHFIHVRSKHKDALPLIVTHGWPGSVIEQLKIIEPLTNPTAHGASASDAFHVLNPPPAEAGGFLAHAGCGSATSSSYTINTSRVETSPVLYGKAWRCACRLGSRSARCALGSRNARTAYPIMWAVFRPGGETPFPALLRRGPIPPRPEGRGVLGGIW
ncbi:epoxide hydrolase N-terminal domain-containing protein [Streptomyces sp. NPDC046900]|uniref:epoxide hydrolase N-terminal domain-containing protein n=1 Tax=Streptomyces sp. NPDC046900 TaxID=3155473 RepID=UPI0033E363FB